MKKQGGTGVVMLNMGGPETLDDVDGFLLGVFDDRDLIQLPFQKVLGRYIAKRRTPKVRALYDAIGGGSPILRWSRAQGEGMCKRLDEVSPETAPHKFYVAFRYTAPFADDALTAMQADGIERAVALTMYPQYSCSTTGSSLNELWRTVERRKLGQTFQWSVLDRWGDHASFAKAFASAVREGLEQYDEKDRDSVYILYSAHSLPLNVIDRGDSYPAEVAASVSRVVEASGLRNPYLLAYQSDVGPVRWLGARTEQVIKDLAAKGYKNVMVVPIAFTSDHIETLSEIDIEYAELAHSLGMTGFKRAPSLNARPDFLDALSEIVSDHLRSGDVCSSQYRTRCPGCTNTNCRRLPARTVGTSTTFNTAGREDTPVPGALRAQVLASKE
ncbi:MAG: ferrochelatase [Gemmatimonas sp.]